MAEKTQYYGLTKPSPEDFYDVNVQNENMDIIDEVLMGKAPTSFYAMLTGDSTNGYTIDKTFAEITAAFSEGKDLWLLESGSSIYWYRLVRATSSTAYFAYTNGKDAYTVTVNQSNTVTKTTFVALKAGHDYDPNAHSDIREALGLAQTTANSAKSTAETALGKANTAAPSSHNHSADNITSGTLIVARGGTGAATAADARTNLGIKTETWTFTLEDGSTVTKVVYVG